MLLSSSFLIVLYFAVVRSYDSGIKVGVDSSAGSRSCQVLVLHLPGVVEGMKGGVPYQVPKRPLARHFACGMERSDRVAVSVAMRLQSVLGHYLLRDLRRGNAHHLCP